MHRKLFAIVSFGKEHCYSAWIWKQTARWSAQPEPKTSQCCEEFAFTPANRRCYVFWFFFAMMRSGGANGACRFILAFRRERSRERCHKFNHGRPQPGSGWRSARAREWERTFGQPKTITNKTIFPEFRKLKRNRNAVQTIFHLFCSRNQSEVNYALYRSTY